jgi:hypothetical protein
MLNKKEMFAVLLAALAIGTVASMGVETIEAWQKIFLPTIGIVIAVIIANIVAKKILAHYFGADIEIKLWSFRRFMYVDKKRIYGYKPHQKFKSEFPAGFFFPLLIKFLSVGLINWMGCLTFDARGTIYRTAKKWQLFQFSDITEAEMAWISFFGIIINIIIAIAGYLTNIPMLSKISLQYAFFNSLPIGNLDGMKIFFGNKTLWATSMVLTGMGLVLSIMIA